MTDSLWTSEELARATRGALSGPFFEVSDVAIDSRQVKKGDLFVAISGEKFDGHDFVASALAQGAAGAVVSHRPADVPTDAPLLVVYDTMTALRDIAIAARARSTATIVAVTGSVGKTGTKDSLKAALSVFGETHASLGNLNNHIGAPLSLARLPLSAAYAVLELGMNHAGEISDLSRLVRPHLCIVTNVEATHIGHFPGIDAVAEAKGEIFEGMRAGHGIAVLNLDNAQYGLLRERAEAAGVERIVTFGRHETADVRLVGCESDAAGSRIVASIDGKLLAYTIDAIGAHWAFNSVGVLACVHALGLDVRQASLAIRSVTAKAGRGRQERIAVGGGSALLIDESYNASPASVGAALDVLAMMKPATGGRRIAILGDMLELGDRTAEMHRELADKAATSADAVFTVGPLMRSLRDALPSERRGGHADASEDMAPVAAAAVQPGDIVLVKGSLGTRMAPIVTAIRALATPRPRAANGH